MKLSELAGHPDMARVLIDHAARGIRIQFALRAVLVVFVALTVALVPPDQSAVAAGALAAAYALWFVVMLLVMFRSTTWHVRYSWLLLYVDTLVLGGMVVLAGVAAAESWTADVLVNGFFLIPVMAAAQLRPWVGVSVCAPALAVYVFASVLARDANDEPWTSIWLRTGLFAAAAAGCVLLSAVQRSRVVTIGSLAVQRNALLTEIIGIEQRERQGLAEHLHDGALQYVLAARHDLEDARATGDPASFARVRHALSETSRQLRTTASQLHPAVLEQSGLRAALEELADDVASRHAFTVEVDTERWPAGVTTSADALLFATARELLGNVLKHADATSVRIVLSLDDETGSLVVEDDGRGVSEDVVAHSLADGHIGIASRRMRLAAASGTLRVLPAAPRGTRVEATAPARPTGTREA